MSNKNISIATLTIGNAKIKVEIHKCIYELVSIYGRENKTISIDSKASEYIDDAIREFIPEGSQIVTRKQIKFIQSISEKLNIQPSWKQLRNIKFASEFIDKNIDEFKIKSSKKLQTEADNKEKMRNHIADLKNKYFKKQSV
ncbi:hypothetical protein [Xenorhabdus sp. BG5]|uniref:hypothetical protein n=1 Tax=Xenorhabdus sp. BG5 TaxID=2782014 RepID=UPI001881DDA4|nr:hypothetical protein [Xenorhabdus sp. BG5]MBE8595044.1 hypothetical protein [Xenorhabdus sp. BG5]